MSLQLDHAQLLPSCEWIDSMPSLKSFSGKPREGLMGQCSIVQAAGVPWATSACTAHHLVSSSLACLFHLSVSCGHRNEQPWTVINGRISIRHLNLNLSRLSHSGKCGTLIVLLRSMAPAIWEACPLSPHSEQDSWSWGGLQGSGVRGLVCFAWDSEFGAQVFSSNCLWSLFLF